MQILQMIGFFLTLLDLGLEVGPLRSVGCFQVTNEVKIVCMGKMNRNLTFRLSESVQTDNASITIGNTLSIFFV